MRVQIAVFLLGAVSSSFYDVPDDIFTSEILSFLDTPSHFQLALTSRFLRGAPQYIRYLDLSGMSFPSGLDFLKTYPKLRTLNLSYLKTPLSSLAFLNHLPDLEHLDLTGTHHNIEDFSPISSLTKLKTLILKDSLLVPACLPLLPLSLEELDLSVSDSEAPFTLSSHRQEPRPLLALSLSLPVSLRRLSVSGWLLSSLAPLGRLENLEHLDLSSCGWSVASSPQLEALETLHKLRILDLMNTDGNMHILPFDFQSVPSSIEKLRIEYMRNIEGVIFPNLRELHVHDLSDPDLLLPFAGQLEILHIKKGRGTQMELILPVLDGMANLLEIWGLTIKNRDGMERLLRSAVRTKVKSMHIEDASVIGTTDPRIYGNLSALSIFGLSMYGLDEESMKYRSLLKALDAMKILKSLTLTSSEKALRVVAERLGETLEHLRIVGDSERSSLDDLRPFKKLKKLEVFSLRLNRVQALEEMEIKDLQELAIFTSERILDFSVLERLRQSRKLLKLKVSLPSLYPM